MPSFKQMPIPAIKTATYVPPDEMNGSGSPVSGIEPLNISYCIIKLQFFF